MRTGSSHISSPTGIPVPPLRTYREGSRKKVLTLTHRSTDSPSPRRGDKTTSPRQNTDDPLRIHREGNVNCYSGGFSIIEVVLAAGIFAIFAVGIAGVVATGFTGGRQGEEQTKATQYASEGLEAVRSIRNQSFNNLVATASAGVTRFSNLWSLFNTSNAFEKYTRNIAIASVQRDGSGNIVASGGTVDPMTWKATSTVSWAASGARNNSVILSTYFSDFRKTILTSGGLLVYGDGTTTPKQRTYDTTNDLFNTQTPAATSSSGVTFTLRTSPNKTEVVAGFVTAAGVLNIMCFDGSAWTLDWSTTVGGTGTTRPFDIAYETNSGNVMVLYSNNVVTTNEMAYRTKPSSSGCGAANWSSATNLTAARTNGIVQWIRLAWDKRTSSNLISAIWADNASDLSAAVWSGSAWGNEPGAALATTLQTVAASQDVEDFDVEYESVSGDVMVVWGITAVANANGVRYATCTGGTSACTWSGILTPPTFVDDATNLDISANPNSDEIVFASIGNNQNDLQIGYWDGGTWTNTANADTSCNGPVAGSKLVSTGWLISGATTRSVVRYADQGSSAIDWYTGNGGTFTKQADFTQSPAPSGPIYYQVEMNPLTKDQLMSLVSDGASSMFAKRLVMDATPTFTWTNSDGAVLVSTLPQGINSPYSFAFWRN